MKTYKEQIEEKKALIVKALHIKAMHVANQEENKDDKDGKDDKDDEDGKDSDDEFIDNQEPENEYGFNEEAIYIDPADLPPESAVDMEPLLGLKMIMMMRWMNLTITRRISIKKMRVSQMTQRSIRTLRKRGRKKRR